MGELIERARLNADMVADYIGASSSSLFIRDCLEEAEAITGNYLGKQAKNIPSHVLRRALILCASELHLRRSAPGGIISDFDDIDASPMRLNRDPLTPVYPLIKPFMLGGFA